MELINKEESFRLNDIELLAVKIYSLSGQINSLEKDIKEKEELLAELKLKKTKLVNLYEENHSHKPTNKNSQLSKGGKPQKNLQEKRESVHSMNGRRYTESGAVVETPATISPADTNPENFDDGVTQVFPGEFRASKPTEAKE